MRDQSLDSDEGKVTLGEFNEKWLAGVEVAHDSGHHGDSDEEGHGHH